MSASNTMIRTELLEMADTVAREKGIDREEVLEAMELAIQKASRTRYGLERDIRANIDRKTGEVHLALYHEVVDDVENDMTQLTLDEAQKVRADITVGEFIIDPLPPIEFGRVAAQTAKQVIFQKVRDAERQRQYDEYKSRIGDIVSGQVKRVEFGNVIVDLGRNEAIIMRDQQIPREVFRPGDRVKAYVMDVRREPRGSQIFLSRSHPHFMAKLFQQEVPEIYDGDIEVKAVARDPGSRAKMAVFAADPTLDPIGACVGMRGSRVQVIVNELQGEKVDIIPWSANPAVFVVNSLVPAEVAKVFLDEDTQRVEVIVPDDQLSLAIGRRGQNVRLASDLTGWHIDIMSESVATERRNAQTKAQVGHFTQALDVDDVIAHLLVAEGFENAEEVANASMSELMSIEGFEEEIAQELQNRAKVFVEKENVRLIARMKELKVDKTLSSFDALTPKLVVQMAEQGLKTLDDLADLAVDELCEICPQLSQGAASSLILKAREHWFAEEK